MPKVPLGVLIADPIISITTGVFIVISGLRLLGVDPGQRRILAAGLTSGSLIAVWTLVNHFFDNSMEVHVLVGVILVVLSIWLVARVRLGLAFAATLIGYLLVSTGAFILMGLFSFIDLDASVVLANPLLYLLAGLVENSIPITLGLILWRRPFTLVDFGEPLPTSGKTLWLLNIFLAQTFGLTMLGLLSLGKRVPAWEVFPIGFPGVVVWTIVAGMPIASILVLREINRLYQAEVQLRQIEGMRLLGRIATRLAHDVRNPISVIMGYAKLLQRGLSNVAGLQGPLLSEAVEGISHEVACVDELVGDLRLLGKPEEGAVEPVNLKALMQEVVDAVGSAEPFAGRGVGVSLETPDSLPQIASHPKRLRRILSSLVAYAVEHCPEGGAVRIRPTYSPDRQSVTLTVANNGSGMPPDYMARIFDPFFTTKEHDTGLGLFAVKKMVEDCGGSIEARSEPGKGIEFAVQFPVRFTASP